jgi:hypothetical protein
MEVVHVAANHAGRPLTRWKVVLMNLTLPLLPPLQSTIPEWLTLAIVVISVALALAAVVMMTQQARPAPGDAAGGERYPRRYLDPVLFSSALVVILLAVVVWILR